MNDMTIAGVTVRRDAEGRYSLNDLHRAAGGEDRYSPNRFTRAETFTALVQELTPDLAFAPVASNRGGAAPGTYVAKELVYAYAMWISAAFHLQVIRAYDALASVGSAAQISGTVSDGCTLIESAARALNLAPSATLGMYQRLGAKAGHADLLPVYAVDAPVGPDGSAPTLALKALLTQHHIPLSSQRVYPLLEAAGLVEHRSRASANRGEKKFWCVTEKGAEFGKNVTHPQNPRETQPHFYESEFGRLLLLIGLEPGGTA